MRKLIFSILLLVTLTSMGQTQIEKPLTYKQFNNSVNITSIDIFNYYIIKIHEVNKNANSVTEVINLELSNDELFAINEIVTYEVNKHCVYILTVIGINTNTWWINEINEWLK